MDAMIEHGNIAAAAKACGIALSSCTTRLQIAREKIQAKHSIQTYILWHNWREASKS